ncbi:MAG: cytochrome c biogenesis protein CcsA, partial [Deltaproteobacteria bacterium]|nr:cytochrome c biogenesis protein CcsA [Deltaproteobacteria bacterium]
ITIASMLLMRSILNHEFIYSYVTSYSSRDLPLLYLISSFWAGQEGSFLLWVLLGAWLGIVLIYKVKDMEPQVMVIYNLNNVFLMILLMKQSPFKMLAFTPPDGNGMNMLLQDPWMAIHPPVVFLGYAAFAIPFAYAMAALWRRDYDRWIKPALPWTVFAFISLGAGIIIGGYWAYKVLGWGGFWGWDPVENASLLPWLAGIALMHGMVLQKTRNKLRKTNFVLAVFSFILVIYCTFLTRSGVLADFSVHSFTDLGITGWLVLFMAVFIAISLYLLLTRAKEIPASGGEKNVHFFSREFGFIAAMILLCLSTVVTGLGTSAPLITRVLEKASKVSTDFYVDTNLPLAILMVILLSFVPLMGWGKNNFSRLAPKLVWALIGAIVTGAVVLLKGYPGIGVLLLALFAGAVAAMNLVLAIKLGRKKISISGSAVAHLGVGLMFLGIVASSIYDQSEKVSLSQGSPGNALGYDINFEGPKVIEEAKGIRLILPLDVKKENIQFTALPDIRSERTRDGKTKRFVHPHIRRGLLSDLYISPVDFNPGERQSVNHLDLKKGQKTQVGDYELVFTAFDVSSGMGQEDSKALSVGANLVVSYKGQDPIELKPFITVGGEHQHSGPSSRVKLPGPDEAYVTLESLNAGEKTIHLDYQGPKPGKETDKQEALPTLIAEVSIKPGMTVLWLGTFLMLFGGCIAIARRWDK